MDTCKSVKCHEKGACIVASICTARDTKSVKMAPYAFPLVRFWISLRTTYGPNKSTIVFVNGGAGLSRASGNRPISCFPNLTFLSLQS